MTSTVHSIFAVVCVTALISHAPAHAAMVTFATPEGANFVGEEVNAKVTFTTSADTIQVVLENLQADPNSVKQAISGIRFTVSTGEDSGSLTSISGIERTVDSDGTYSDAGSATTGWVLATANGQLHLDVLAFPGQPRRMIIGPPNSGTDEYDNANTSVSNSNHNPFVAEMASFLLSVTGVTTDSTITDVVFQFNSATGYEVVGVHTPEPTSLVPIVIGLVFLGIFQQRRQRAIIS